MLEISFPAPSLYVERLYRCLIRRNIHSYTQGVVRKSIIRQDDEMMEDRPAGPTWYASCRDHCNRVASSI